MSGKNLREGPHSLQSGMNDGMGLRPQRCLCCVHVERTPVVACSAPARNLPLVRRCLSITEKRCRALICARLRFPLRMPRRHGQHDAAHRADCGEPHCASSASSSAIRLVSGSITVFISSSE